MKFRNIFWGVILIFLGVLFIAENFGWLHFDWMNLWRLWPVIIVLWGIAILPAHSLIKTALTLLVLSGSIYFMVMNTDVYEERDYSWKFEDKGFKWDIDREDDENEIIDQSFNIPFDDTVATAFLELDVALGAFILEDATHNLVDFNKKGSRTKYSKKVSLDSNHVDVRIKSDQIVINSGNDKNYVELNLNKYPVWDFDLDVGMASLSFDLTDYKVNELNLDGGAAELDIRLGDKHPETRLDIDAGGASLKIRIPETSGCDVKISSVLSDKSLYGFEDLSDGHYQTENFSKAENKIYIKVDAGFSEITFTRY